MAVTMLQESGTLHLEIIVHIALGKYHNHVSSHHMFYPITGYTYGLLGEIMEKLSSLANSTPSC